MYKLAWSGLCRVLEAAEVEIQIVGVANSHVQKHMLDFALVRCICI